MSCSCCHACEPVVLYEQQVVIAMVCVTAWCCSSMSIALHRCCLSCLTCVLCVFMQLSLRSVWRCTWMAIAAPLATCGGYGRRAGGGHGVGGMRKACYLCQVEVVFQQRMCRLFCMALDVRFKGSLSASCVYACRVFELRCQQHGCRLFCSFLCDRGVVCSAVVSAL